MSWYATELHKFVIGDIRTDGWKSDWRREQERRRAEEMGERKFVRMPEIKIVQKKPRPSRAKTPKNPGFTRSGVPSGMSNVESNRYRRRMWRSQGLCGGCGTAPALNSLYSCGSCLERKARDWSRKSGKPYVEKKERGFCKDCQKLLKSSNVYGYCQAHYRKRRHYLKAAA